jgi:tyrosyl-tRNA synthetase
VDPAKTVVTYNGEWFSKMTFTEVTRLLSQITVAQMLEREDFQNRYRGGQPISLHEFLYPMMQAYDSVQIEADVELGGTDQKFNVLRGRELQRALGKEPQVGMFLPILLGTDGREKMSKSLGNTIGIDEPPQAMYHKLYSLPDALVESYFELLTDLPMDRVRNRIANQPNPNAVKDELARHIVAQYHGAEAAESAAQEERRIHAGDAVPENAPRIRLGAGEHWVPALLVEAGLAKSNGDGRRLIENGGVTFDGQKVADGKARVSVTGEHVLRAGKRNFVKVVAG